MMKGLLDSVTDELFSQVDDVLGDPITYKVVGKSAKTVWGKINHQDKEVGFSGVQITNQDIVIEIQKTDVPIVSATDLITLPELGKSFYPNGAPADSPSGRTVFIALKRARA